MSWQEDAKCRGMDVNFFFPNRGNEAFRRGREVKKVCGDCPVKEQCLEEGMSQQIFVGFYGGLSAEARYQLAKTRRREGRQIEVA